MTRMSRLLVVAIGAAVVLLGCVDRKVAGSGTSGGAETGSGSGVSGSGGSSQGPEPTGGGATGGTSGGTSGETSVGTGSDTTGGTTVDAGCSGGDFVIHPDVGGSVIECDVYQQNCGPCGKCVAWAEGGGGAWNATKCVQVTGDRQPGESCMVEGSGVSGIDDCEKGAMCWDVNGEGIGTCVALCTGAPDAPVCEGNTYCAISSEGVLNLCLPKCDPLLQDCDGTDLCIPAADRFKCVLDGSGDMGKVNDPCEFANSCDKGLLCLNTSAASSACMQDFIGCCQPFCDFSMMEACPNPDQECVQWYDPMMPIPPGDEDVGVCAIPA